MCNYAPGDDAPPSTIIEETLHTSSELVDLDVVSVLSAIIDS